MRPWDSLQLELGRDAWRSRRIGIGPVIITTRKQQGHSIRNAFNLGRDYGALAGPAPSTMPERRLHVVS